MCSECSRVVRPVVALDIDETLGLYHEHFRRFASGYVGRELPEGYDGSEPFWSYLGLELFKYRQVKLAYRQGGMKRSMPVREGARELVSKAHELGAEIWITTTRPYLRLDNIDPDTQEWIARNGLRYDHMLYDEDKYLQLASLVDPDRVVFVLDDLREQVEAATSVFGDAVWQAWGPSNSSVNARWERGCATLMAAKAIMTNNIEAWYKGRRANT